MIFSVEDLVGFAIWKSSEPQFVEMSTSQAPPAISKKLGGLLSVCCLCLVGFCITSFYKSEDLRLFNFKSFTANSTTVTVKDPDSSINYGARPNVQTRTSWNAPIMWEGMWDPQEYDRIHHDNRTSVALTVFAVGRYLEKYLKTFLVSAEQHFMVGFPVMFYVFTDRPSDVPKIDLGPRRFLRVIPVERHSRWQDISMMRMKTISEMIESEIQYLFTHVFCFDVDQSFTARFGSEALSDSVALLHAHYYKLPKNWFTYDRNPKSKAYMETGDYYYHAAIFGGTWGNVKAIADACLAGIMEDKENNVEALWHDESHLNKHFWLHKPTKLLSPEYCWDLSLNRQDIIVIRLIWAEKDYNGLRDKL